MDNLISDVKKWLNNPHKENGDIIDWFLFIGLLTACTILWTRVIKRLVD